MDFQNVPEALREQLGPEATLGLLSVIESAGREWKDETMTAAAERFERRLVEESAKLRVDMAGIEGRLLAKISEVKSDVLKWSFVFWMGQVITMTAIMSVLLRNL